MEGIKAIIEALSKSATHLGYLEIDFRLYKQDLEQNIKENREGKIGLNHNYFMDHLNSALYDHINLTKYLKNNLLGPVITRAIESKLLSEKEIWKRAKEIRDDLIHPGSKSREKILSSINQLKDYLPILSTNLWAFISNYYSEYEKEIRELVIKKVDWYERHERK